jgi:5,10-methylenetetrahydromethanopterin reductase
MPGDTIRAADGAASLIIKKRWTNAAGSEEPAEGNEPMTGFGISMGVSPREPLLRSGDVVAEAERRGFEVAWVIDFQLGMKDVYAALTTIALATDRIGIGPGVTNLRTRHATVTANAIAALDELSGGRAILGLGAGATAVSGAGLKPATLADIRQGVAFLRRLFAGDEAEYRGSTARLAAATGRAVPIYLAVSQPGMLRLCGEIADGAILMGAADPAFCRWQLEHIYRGLEIAGRSRNDFIVDLLATVSVDDNQVKAVADVRAWATSQASDFGSWKELPAGFERFHEDYERADRSYELIEHLSLHAPHNVVVSDEFARTVAIAGDEDHCVERLRELASLDVDRISFALLSGGRMRRLEEFSERIIPRIGS